MPTSPTSKSPAAVLRDAAANLTPAPRGALNAAADLIDAHAVAHGVTYVPVPTGRLAAVHNLRQQWARELEAHEPQHRVYGTAIAFRHAVDLALGVPDAIRPTRRNAATGAAGPAPGAGPGAAGDVHHNGGASGV